MNNVNEAVRTLIGMDYLNLNGGQEEETPFVKSAFDKISEVNSLLFDKIPYVVVFTSDDPYTSAAHMREEVAKTNKIYIYDGWEGHPFLTLDQNLIGRAVHDVFAHMVCGCPFTFEGELTAYYEQRKHYPRWTWDVLMAEIPGQTAAYYANGKSHKFPQRAMEAPKWWSEVLPLVDLPDYSANSVLSSPSFTLKKEVI